MQEAREQETREQEAVDVAAVWGIPLAAVHCPHCKEAHLVPRDAIPPLCPLCLQGPVEPQPAVLREEPPEQVVPYAISPQALAGALERWAAGGWFRPDDLKASTLVQRAQRYLVPLWLVDGRIEGAFRADVGFDYQVVSSQDRYREGAGWSSQQVQETRVRWEPRVGRVSRAYENVIAPALDDHRAVMSRLGDGSTELAEVYDLRQRAPYDAQAIQGGVVRIPTLEPEAAWPGAEAAFVRTAQAEAQQAASADHIRDFTIQAEYRDLNWTLLLLPAYVTWYREAGHTWPILVNGQSGRVSGARLASARKANTTALVLGGIAAFLFVAGGLLALLLPPLGAVLLVVALLLGIVAPIPAISVWVANRRATEERHGQS
jgi:hypothetical protein